MLKFFLIRFLTNTLKTFANMTLNKKPTIITNQYSSIFMKISEREIAMPTHGTPSTTVKVVKLLQRMVERKKAY